MMRINRALGITLSGHPAKSNRPRSPKEARQRSSCELTDDPALHQARNGGDLVAGDALSHLVRDRGACRRRHGRAWDHPEGGGDENLGQGQERQVRHRAHRGDRARDQARRRRLPHPSGRDRGAGSALRASGHDVVRRARHLPQRAARARRRPPHRRRGKAQRRAQTPRARIQVHADHRPLARHSCRADDVRAQARLRLCRVRPRQGSA